MNINYDCRWTLKHWRKGKVIWELVDKKNLLVNEGEKAIVDTFFRNNSGDYFSAARFYVGFFNGSIAETTVLSTLPSEPAVANGYSRQIIERSNVGFPTIEQDDGDWRVVSKELEYTASGGNIGPINGAFLGTSSDNTGSLIGSLSFGTERTIIAGDTMTVYMRAKLK
jgi:hypothetical protein